MIQTPNPAITIVLLGSGRSTTGCDGSLRLETDTVPRRILRVAPRSGIPNGQGTFYLFIESHLIYTLRSVMKL